MNAFLLAILGQRGYGKTSLLKGYDGAEGGSSRPGLIGAIQGPVVVCDPIGTFGEIAEAIPGPGALAKLLLAEHRGQVQYDSNIYRVSVSDDKESARLFELIRGSKWGCTLVVDEASMFRQDENLSAIVQYNRNPELGGQSVVVVARRAKELPPNVRSQANAVVSFRQTEPGDVADLRRIGFSDAVQDLERGDALVEGDVDSLPLSVQNVIDEWTV